MLKKALQKIDSHKKGIALIIAAVALTIALLLMILYPSPVVIVLSVLGLVVFLSVAAALYFKGVVLGVFFATYALLFTIAVTIGVTLQLLFPAASSNSNNRVIIMLTLAAMWVLPRKIRSKVSNFLSPNDQKDAETPVSEKCSYNQLVVKRGALWRASRPYLLDKLPPVQRKIRLVIGFLLVGIGLCGLFFGALLEDSVEPYYISLFCCLGGLLLASIGAFIFIVGYVRSISSHAVIAATGVCIYFLFFESQGKSTLYITALIVVFITLITLIFVGSSRFLKSQNAFIQFGSYEKGDESIALDLLLLGMYPIDKYDTINCWSVKLSPQRGAEKISEITEWLTKFMNIKKFILCGNRMKQIEHGNALITFYIYSNQKNSALLRKKAMQLDSKNTTITCTKDEEWLCLHNDIIPDTYSLNTIYNLNLSATLENDGYDFSKPLPIVYTLVFAEESKAISCCSSAEENGYSLAVHYPCDDINRNDDALEFSHIVYVQNHCRAGVEQLNSQTEKIINFAETFNGKLYDFSIGELEEPNLNK